MRRLTTALAVTAYFLLSHPAVSQPAGPAPDPAGAGRSAPADPKVDEARAHFERGVTLFEEQAWDAAFAEFRRSRELHPTRAGTLDAAICLRKLHRFDESADMFEALLRDFPNLPAGDKASAERALEELRALIGTIEVRGTEPGSTVAVDSRDRTADKPPFRVSAGTHVVRVYREGYTPFETRVEVAGGQRAVVEARLSALTQAGRMRVSEQAGKSLDVVVDGAAVGKTPWEGPLTPGNHTVALRGEGKIGTQPITAAVQLNQTTSLNLVSEELDATLHVRVIPGVASVAVDGVVVGRGAWEGRVRAGQHQVDVSSDGFLPFTRQVVVQRDKDETLSAELDRDLGRSGGEASRLVIELGGGVALAPSLGGDIVDGCSGDCKKSLGIGAHVVGRGAYQLGTGLLLSLDVGYLSAQQRLSNRQASVTPVGRAPDPSSDTTDTLRLRGLTVGAAAGVHKGTKLPVTARVGVGALIGSLSDARNGTFVSGGTAVPYTVDVAQSASASYFYVAPEARLGVRVGEHLEFNFGVEVMVLVALSQPKWSNEPVLAGAGGLGVFGAQTLAGKTIVLAAPGVGVSYAF